MNIVPCLTWVKRGVAESRPHKVELDEDELKKLILTNKEDLDDLENTDSDESDSKDRTQSKIKKLGKRKHSNDDNDGGNDEDDDIISKYNLDDYDDDENDNEETLISGIGGLSFYASNADDPYITLKEDVDSDDDDFEIKPSDNLVLAGSTRKSHSLLEVYVYNEELANLYVHHEYLLPSYPLAVEWMDYDTCDGSTGNFAAIGTMEPLIEIWNLDVVEVLEPAVVLGVKKKKKNSSSQKNIGHTDAVLDLSWNVPVRNVLASASADHTIAVWDLSNQKVVTTITDHTDKVQCVKWHPMEAQTLLSGGFDKTVHVYDCRNPSESKKVWSMEGEVERVVWDTFSPVNFFATSDQGTVYYMDIRQDDKPVYTLKAHNDAVIGVCLSSEIKGLLITTGGKVVKIWDVDGGKPSLILEHNLKLQQVYCVGNCPDAPFVFAFGGEREIKVWDIRESAKVRKHFLNRMPETLAAQCDGDDNDLPEATPFDEDVDADSDDDEDEDEDSILKEMHEATSKSGKKKKPKKKKKFKNKKRRT